MNGEEGTLFLIKPHGRPYSEQIIHYVNGAVRQRGARIESIEIGVRIEKAFLEEFYLKLKRNLPDRYEDLEKQYMAQGGKMDFVVIRGKGIIKFLKELNGATEYEKTRPGEIRFEWGPYKLPNNFTHASSPGESARDIAISKKYGYI
ncbi:MAG: nucleoside-diphosphate kinase [archaeon]